MQMQSWADPWVESEWDHHKYVTQNHEHFFQWFLALDEDALCTLRWSTRGEQKRERGCGCVTFIPCSCTRCFSASSLANQQPP